MSMECDIYPFNVLTLLVGQREGHPACKKLGIGVLLVTILLDFCTCQGHFHHDWLQ